MRKTMLILSNDSEGLQPVYGIPAVRRLVMMALRLGFDGIHLVGRDLHSFEAVSDLVAADAFHLIQDRVDAYEAVRQLDFDEDEAVLVAKANHVIDRWSLERLVRAGEGKEIAVLRSNGTQNDKAIYLVKASYLLPLLVSLQSCAGQKAGIEDRALCVLAGKGLPELIRQDSESVRCAEAGLAAAVAESTWHRDSFLSRYVNRPISQVISPALARTGITANAVTLLNALLGLAGAYMIFRGGYISQIVGSLLFVLCTVVDGVDGEIARLKLQETDFGQILDVTCDNIVHVSVFGAIGVSLYHETGNVYFLYLLYALAFGLGLCALLINRIMAGNSRGPVPTRVEVLLEMLFNNRDFAYVVLGFALFHRLDWFFVASTLGIYVLTAILWAAKLASRFVNLPQRKISGGPADMENFDKY